MLVINWPMFYKIFMWTNNTIIFSYVFNKNKKFINHILDHLVYVLRVSIIPLIVVCVKKSHVSKTPDCNVLVETEFNIIWVI